MSEWFEEESEGLEDEWGDEPTVESWTVTELCERVSDALAAAFPGDVWVEGEIADMSRANSGHVYFRLVDPDAPKGRSPGISVTLFKWFKEKVNLRIRSFGGGIRMEDGVRVRIRGTLELYGARGQVQLRMNSIDPAFTIGGLVADRDRLLAALAAEGILRRNALVPVPLLPLRIAVVTSRGSAAAADFRHEIEASGLGFHILQVDARMQGRDAPGSVTAALATAVHLEPDVIALVRGGGARTELATFDHEAIARAITACPWPVFTGIGHEVDRSVADEVAHSAHKTPTACAAALVDLVRAAHEECERLWEQVGRCATASLDRAEHRVDRVALRVPAATRGGLRDGERRVADLAARTTRAARHRLDRERQRVDTLSTCVTAHDPAVLLGRGWSITRTEDGRTVRDPAEAPPGAVLHTTVLGGRLTSRVEHSEEEPS